LAVMSTRPTPTRQFAPSGEMGVGGAFTAGRVRGGVLSGVLAALAPMLLVGLHDAHGPLLVIGGALAVSRAVPARV
jgi:hypothetical protein